MQRSTILLTAVLAWFGVTDLSAAAVDYAKQIQPIFMKHCAGCHGEKKGLGKLRLHTPAAIQKKWDKDEHLIVRGDAEKSELYERLVLPEGHKKLMPKKADPLSEEKIALIRKWIDEGAVFGVVAEAKPEADEKTEATEADGDGHGEEKPVAAPAEVPLPEVGAAEVAAVEKLVAGGAQVNPLFAGSSLLQVSYALRGEPATDAELALLEAVAEQVIALGLVEGAGLGPWVGGFGGVEEPEDVASGAFVGDGQRVGASERVGELAVFERLWDGDYRRGAEAFGRFEKLAEALCLEDEGFL